MKISVLYIVKDEEKIFKRSLQSLSVIGDIYEVIVVDTGSVDKSRQIAQDFGARVFSFPWEDDFSKARNFALQKACGDFIVFLDADEYFVDKKRGALQKAIEHAQKMHTDALALHMIHIESDTQKDIGEFFALRAFRRDGIAYKGAIHETIYREDKKPLKIDFVDKEEVTLLHTGYEERLSKKKAHRNLKFLLKELAKNEDPKRLYPYLAETYDALEDEDKALFYASLAVETRHQNESFGSRSYRVLLRILARRPEDRERRLLMARSAREAYQELPEFAAEYAECLAGNYEYKKAISIMREALLPKPFNPLEISLFTADFRRLAKERLHSWEKLEDRAKNLTISACLIGKNVIKDLPSYVEGAKIFSDEIIYVDTGSDDDSLAFMQKEGAKVFSYPWEGDFSRAKNFALGKAASEWIVFLDADETFYFPERVRYVVADLKAKEDTVYLVPIINVDEDEHEREIQRFYAVRIFPRKKGFAYAGKIHETLKINATLPKKECLEGLPVRHTGYSSRRIYAKLLRNVVILEEEFFQKKNMEALYYLPECYLGLKRYHKAALYGEKALRSPYHSTISDSDLYHTIICAYQKLGDTKSEERMLQEAIKKFPRIPDFWGLYGIFCYEHHQDVKKTIHNLQAAIVLVEKKESFSTATRFQSFLDKIYAYYAKLLLKHARKEEAKKYSKRALELNGEYRLARSVYKDSLSLLDAHEKAKLLADFLPRTKESLRSLIMWANDEEEWDLKDIYEEELQKDFGIENADGLSYLYDLKREHEWQKLHDALLKELGTRVPELFLLLLELAKSKDPRIEDLIGEVRVLLPKDAEELFNVYMGDGELNKELLNTYHLFIPFIAKSASQSVKEDYIALAKHLPDEDIVMIGAAFQRESNFREALSLYSLLPATSKMVDGHFWHIVGVALYQIGDKEGAKESLEKSLAMGYDVPEIHAYLSWLQEGGEQDN